MKRIILQMFMGLSVVSICALPTQVNANNFNYTNLEFGGTWDIDTLYTLGSLSIMENAHLSSSLSSQFDDDWVATLGIGFHAPATKGSDLFGNLIFYNIKTADSNEDWYGDFAFGVNVGSRIWLGSTFEVNFSLGKISYNDNTNSVVTLGARFHSNERISIGLHYNTTGLYDQKLFMNVRFEY